MVSRHTPGWDFSSSISYVIVVNGSPDVVGSMSMRQVCLSRRGGSDSRTWPSRILSGSVKPFSFAYACISSVGVQWKLPPGLRS